MGSLARPVTADQSQDHAGYNKYTDEYDRSLHHMSVPFILPSATLIAIAEMNMPEMMYTRSMLEHVDAKVYAHCHDHDPEC